MTIRFRVCSVLATVVFAGLMIGADKADLSTPKSAAKAFAHAVISNDADTAKQAATGAESKTIEGVVALAANLMKLQAAAKSKFGDNAFGDNDLKQFVEIEKQVDAATEKDDGDSATFASATDPEFLKLKKIDGNWKVDLSDLQKASALFDVFNKAAVETTNEINDGKYKSSKEAQDAFGGKMLAALSGPPASQPAK